MKKIVKNLKKVMSNKRVLSCLVLFLICTVSAFAQTATGNAAGVEAINNVSTDIAAYLPAVQKVIYAIAGVVALIGAVGVYISMQNDEQDVKKKIMMTVGSCIFLIAAATALPLFFGLGTGN